MSNSLTLFTLCVVAFVAGSGFTLLAPVAPLYAAELGATVSQVGPILATVPYTITLFLIPSGILCDRLGRHNFLIAGLAISTVAPLLLPLATNWSHLVLIVAMHGLAQAAFLPGAAALVIDLAPEERRGEALGWYTASLHLGLMAGPITGGLLFDQLGFDPVFYARSALSLLGLAIVLWRRRAIVVHPAPADESTGVSSWRWMKQVLAMVGLLSPLFIAVGQATVITYIPLYGKELGMIGAGAGWIITAIFAGSALSRIPGGRLSDRLGRKPMILCGLALSAAAVALFSLFDSVPELMATGALLGIGMGTATPASFALIADLSPAQARGQSMAVPICFLQAGLAIGATAMGSVAGASSFPTMFLACGCGVAAGFLVIVGLMRAR